MESMTYCCYPSTSPLQWQKSVLDTISNYESTAQEILAALKENPQVKEYYDLSAGVVEGYTVGEHTQMVLELAHKYRTYFQAELEGIMDWSDFLLFLALHDIGKGISKKFERNGVSAKEAELLANRKIATGIAEQLWLSSKLGHLFQAMLLHDSQGDYLQGNIDADTYLNHLLDMSAICLHPPAQFYKIYHAFHILDAASYPNLKPLFIFEDDKLRHCEAYQSLLDSFKQRLIGNSS